MLPEVSKEELAAALDAVARKILTEVGLHAPPVDAILMAGRLGLTVAWDDRQPGRARHVQLVSGQASGSILLRPEPRPERQHWAVAHEIGETAAGRVFAQLGIDVREAPRQAREMVANGLASRLLLPAASLAIDGDACHWDLLALKERYSTASHELIARRMLDFVQPVIVAVHDQNRLSWRKSNLATRPRKPSLQELAAVRRAHETSESVRDEGPPAVRAWPIHEPLWKREIVRVEIDEFAD